ncbi:MAG: TolC family protein [Myxococcota bacterium]
MHRLRPGALAALLYVPFLLAGAPAGAADCRARVDRVSAAACAVEAALEVESAAQDEDAARARLRAAEVVLPSNPELGFSAGRRTGPEGLAALNWSASLAQTIEIGGQRGARRALAEQELRGQEASVRVRRQAASARGLIAYFNALSAAELVELSERLASVAEALSRVALGRAKAGVSPPLEAAVADAAGIQLQRVRIEALAEVERRRAQLAITLGLDASARPALAGTLAPIPFEETAFGPLFEEADRSRLELRALASAVEAAEARVSLLERARIPSLTLSAMVQRDGFEETYWGGGLSIPIPLPAPLGRTNAPEIAEAEALARRAALELERGRREIHLEVVERAKGYESRRAALGLFDPSRMAEAETLLSALGEEIGAGNIGAREALASEQALLEMLKSYVEARREAAIASVELARAVGRDLEGGAP